MRIEVDFEFEMEFKAWRILNKVAFGNKRIEMSCYPGVPGSGKKRASRSRAGIFRNCQIGRGTVTLAAVEKFSWLYCSRNLSIGVNTKAVYICMFNSAPETYFEECTRNLKSIQKLKDPVIHL